MINPLDIDPKCEGGTADATPAFKAAIAMSLASKKEPIYIPEGVFRLTEKLVLQEPISFFSNGSPLTVSSTPNDVSGGAWLHFDHSDHGLYYRDDNAVGICKKFAKIVGIGFKRTQPAPGASWAPSAHAHDLRVEFGVDLQDVVFLNPTKAAYIRSAGILTCQNVRGQPLSIGFECERSPDFQRWNGVHWWPYWSVDSTVLDYTIANAYGFKVRRADGLSAINPFGYGYKRLFHFQDVTGDNGGASTVTIQDAYADQGGGLIELHSDFYQADLKLVNGRQHCDLGGRGTGAGIEIAGSVASSIDLTNYSCTRAPAEALKVTGAHIVRGNLSRVAGWNMLNNTSYAVRSDGATVQLSNLPEFGPPAAGSSANKYQKVNGGTVTVPTMVAA